MKTINNAIIKNQFSYYTPKLTDHSENSCIHVELYSVISYKAGSGCFICISEHSNEMYSPIMVFRNALISTFVHLLFSAASVSQDHNNSCFFSFVCCIYVYIQMCLWMLNNLMTVNGWNFRILYNSCGVISFSNFWTCSTYSKSESSELFLTWYWPPICHRVLVGGVYPGQTITVPVLILEQLHLFSLILNFSCIFLKMFQ